MSHSSFYASSWRYASSLWQRITPQERSRLLSLRAEILRRQNFSRAGALRLPLSTMAAIVSASVAASSVGVCAQFSVHNGSTSVVLVDGQYPLPSASSVPWDSSVLSVTTESGTYALTNGVPWYTRNVLVLPGGGILSPESDLGTPARWALLGFGTASVWNIFGLCLSIVRKLYRQSPSLSD